MHTLHLVRNDNLYTELVGNVTGNMLGAVYGTVLAAGAATTDLNVREAALHIRIDHIVDHRICIFKEFGNIALCFQEFDYRLVHTCQFLIRFITAGIVYGAAVEHETSAIAGQIVGNAALVRKADNVDSKFL